MLPNFPSMVDPRRNIRNRLNGEYSSAFNSQIDANPTGWFQIKEFAYGKDESWTNQGTNKISWKNAVLIDKTA
jgi:hypothetical protein